MLMSLSEVTCMNSRQCLPRYYIRHVLLLCLTNIYIDFSMPKIILLVTTNGLIEVYKNEKKAIFF